MKKLKLLSLAVACTLGFSFGSSAGIPGVDDCEAWKQFYTSCEIGAEIHYYGYSCSELYDNWTYCIENF